MTPITQAATVPAFVFESAMYRSFDHNVSTPSGILPNTWAEV
jgi:hypothetical protein